MRINLGLILYVSLEVFASLEWCFSVENFPKIFFFFAKYYTVILVNDTKNISFIFYIFC